MTKNLKSRRFSKRLIQWHLTHGRHNLPWQKRQTAYRVWISEIMLQQTQVTTVIPYFQRFMKRFPSLKKLALASQDDVLAHWSGLGYYARARNLHKTAQIIHRDYHGKFPNCVDTLQTLPGIGRSTAGAVLSFAYQTYAPICDGNVKRVLARYFAVDMPKQTTAAINYFWELAISLTPESETALYNQAIMDLGATLCSRTKPTCPACPLHKDCKAYLQGHPTHYPVSKKKQKKPTRHTKMLIIRSNDHHLLLEKRPQTGIWAGLWSFIESESIPTKAWLSKKLNKKPLEVLPLPLVPHEFTHFKLIIEPILIQSQMSEPNEDNLKWHALSNISSLGTPSVLSKIIEQIELSTLSAIDK